MTTKERIESAGLVPTGEEFFIGISKEAPDICTCERETRDAVAENHWQRSSQVRPASLVVTCPHGAKSLTSSKVSTRKNERSTNFAILSFQEGIICSIHKRHTIQVMNVPMLPIPIMQIVFWHCRLRTIK